VYSVQFNFRAVILPKFGRIFYGHTGPSEVIVCLKAVWGVDV